MSLPETVPLFALFIYSFGLTIYIRLYELERENCLPFFLSSFCLFKRQIVFLFVGNEACLSQYTSRSLN